MEESGVMEEPVSMAAMEESGVMAVVLAELLALAELLSSAAALELVLAELSSAEAVSAAAGLELALGLVGLSDTRSSPVHDQDTGSSNRLSLAHPGNTDFRHSKHR